MVLMGTTFSSETCLWPRPSCPLTSSSVAIRESVMFPVSVSPVGSSAVHSTPEVFPRGHYYKCNSSVLTEAKGGLPKLHCKHKGEGGLFWATRSLVCIQNCDHGRAFKDLGARSC